MTKHLFTRLLQASLMCCMAVLFTACDEIFGREDSPVSAYMTFSDKAVTIKVGETFQRQAITASRVVVEYSSSNTAVATVDGAGTVTGVAEGEATITAIVSGKNVDGKRTFRPDQKSYVVTVKAAAPSAKITTAPTATASVKAGSSTALVTAGVADGGTMMYAVTTVNTKPTATDGFSATIPTAATLAAGTYYVWYYAKADATHTDSNISATAVEVTVTKILTMLETPLTFEAKTAGAVVKFKANNDAVAKDIEWSLDGTTWTAANTGGSGVSIILVNAGDKVMFRGTNAAYSDGGSISNISCDNDCYIYGNIMSLIKKEDFENVTTFTANNTFRRLFENNAKIKNHTDATKYLVLPATKMTANCYRNMFYGCAGLTTTPVINVDCDGKASCMERMFFNCTGLTTVAEGSKISGNMGSYSCSEMFSGCSNLESVPSDLLPATSLAMSCYYYMFQNCAKLKKAPKLPAETLKTYCYYHMFDGCTDLNEAWVKANYTIANNECLGMFDGCTTANNATSKFHSAYAANYKGAFAGLSNWTADTTY